jgi:chromosome segregation ATPase
MDIQNLSPEVQQRWAAWLENRVVRLRDAMADGLGETAKDILEQHDADLVKLRQELRDATGNALVEYRSDLAKLRQELRDATGDYRRQNADANAALRREISELRNSPPLFQAPDKKLSAAMVRVGEEIHRLGEGIEAARGAVAECAKRSDLGAVRQRLENRIAEIEERGESVEKNLHAASRMLFNTSEALQRVHALLARLAVATDCEHILTAVDKSRLPPDEQKPSAAVFAIEDLRYARSA